VASVLVAAFWANVGSLSLHGKQQFRFSLGFAFSASFQDKWCPAPWALAFAAAGHLLLASFFVVFRYLSWKLMKR
jgi:hypothetical protein